MTVTSRSRPHCSATENDPGDSALIDTSYTWARPDLGGTVTIASAAEPAQLVVTNTATRRWSGLEVTKAYAGAPGGFASDLSVTGAWACTYRGQVAASGSWTLPASGGTVVLARPADAAIPAESSCAVTENSLSAADLVDSSWAWQPTRYSPGQRLRHDERRRDRPGQRHQRHRPAEAVVHRQQAPAARFRRCHLRAGGQPDLLREVPLHPRRRRAQ